MVEKIVEIVRPIDAPEVVETGGDAAHDIRMVNNGPSGPTFLRLVDKLGNIVNKISTPNHETGDATIGFHSYHMMPKTHLILRIEVGIGTADDPVEVTDRDMLVILNIDLPAPDMNTVELQFELVYPVMMFPSAVVPIVGYPGQITYTSIFCKNLWEEAPTHKIQFNITIQGAIDTEELKPSWTVDGVVHTNEAVYEIAGGQTIEIITTVTVPVEIPAGSSIRIVPVKVEVV